MEQEKDIKNLAETYAETKRAANQLQARLKELEAELKECGFDKLESDTYKITIYETAARKTFDLNKFKEINPDLDYSKPEYYKETASSKSIKFTEINKDKTNGN